MAQQRTKPNKKQKQQAEDLGAWDRFSRWLGRNQKVVMVVLLVLIAPLFAFTGPVMDYFSPGAGKQVVSELFGSAVTQAQVERSGRMLRAARVLDQSGYFEMSRIGGGNDGNPLDFLALKAKAEQLGIGVSDAELGGRIQDAWRRLVAAEYAQKTVAVPPGPGNQQQAFQVYFQRQQKMQERAEELKASGTFDVKDWLARIQKVRAQPRDVEETLRDVYTIGKLQSHVLNDVQVSAKDVYDEFLVENEKRTLSWIEVTSSEALIEKFGQKATEEEVQRYYDENAEKFRREEALRANYVIVPLDYFKTSVEDSVTDADSEEAYTKNRDDFRRPTIRTDEAQFLLLTAEEQAARDAEVYLPLAEVKDQVREKVIEDKAAKELQTLVSGLQRRLADKTVPVTPDALAKEYPFLQVGQTGFATRDDAEEVFGDAYVELAVSGWFGRLSGDRRAKIEPPPFAQRLPDDKGRVFYTGVETRRASTPRFRAITGEVRTALGAERALRAVGEALKKLAETQNAAGSVDLAALANTEISVEVAPGEAVPVPAGNVEVASGPFKQTETLKVGQAAEEGSDAEEDAETSVENSRVILAAGFTIADVGKAAATTTIEATSPRFGASQDEAAAYLVVLDAKSEADPAEFDDNMKQRVERQLLREKQDEHLSKWRAELYREAYGQEPAAAEEVAASSP